jgi:hypothetical protein
MGATQKTGDKAGAAPAPPASRALRFRQRLFQPWAGLRATTAAQLPEPVARKKMSFQASIAEFLLVNRLRARKRAEPSADVLERAAHIVFVTCKNWFAARKEGRPDHRTHL